MKAVIMSDGREMCISELFPEPLIPICGRSVVEHEIGCLHKQGLADIILTVSHMVKKIIDYFGNGAEFGVHIDYFVEDKPLGNTGALFKLKDKLTEDFLLLNVDSVFNIDFNCFVAFHKEHNALATLFTHLNDHPYDSGLYHRRRE